jgi:hypothetical protein
MRALDFEQLPDEAQSIICSLASTPSCPTHALLALVSKKWDAIAAQHFQLDGAGVALQLSCSTSSTTEQKRREVERLVGLAMWLQRRGPRVNTLDVHIHPFRPQEQQHFVLGRGHGITGILEALAAAGKRPGGLRLQQLRLPALGCTPPSTICQALSSCQQLKALQLDYVCAAGTVDATSYLSGDLCTALQQLTQLTSLHLSVGKFKQKPGAVRLHELFQALPSSTQDLGLDFIQERSCNIPFILDTNSMSRLTALRHLGLPGSVSIDSEDASGDLEPLTALTSLAFPGAVDNRGKPLLALPCLAQVSGHAAHLQCLQLLAVKPTLRHLACDLVPGPHDDTPAFAAALKRLTQLTGLSLGTLAVPAPARVAVGAVVASLTGLQSLTLQPVVLERVPMAALTALTHVAIDARRSGLDKAYGPQRIKKLLRKLAPAKGRLRVLQVTGAEEGKQELWAAAAAAVLGDVLVEF